MNRILVRILLSFLIIRAAFNLLQMLNGQNLSILSDLKDNGMDLFIFSYYTTGVISVLMGVFAVLSWKLNPERIKWLCVLLIPQFLAVNFTSGESLYQIYFGPRPKFFIGPALDTLNNLSFEISSHNQDLPPGIYINLFAVLFFFVFAYVINFMGINTKLKPLISKFKNRAQKI